MKVSIEYKGYKFSWKEGDTHLDMFAEDRCVGKLDESVATKSIFQALRKIAKEIQKASTNDRKEMAGTDRIRA